MMRTEKHEHFVKFSKYLDIPIINGLTNLSHPCQIMSDIMTFEELKGPIANKKIAWLGDGNNIVYSLIEAAVQFNFKLAIGFKTKSNSGFINLVFIPNQKVLCISENPSSFCTT